MTTHASGPTGAHWRCGPNPPVGTEVFGFDVISAKNFRSASISAQTPVVAGSMKPRNTSFVIDGLMRVVSIVAATGCAAAVPAIKTISVDSRTHRLWLCISVLRSTRGA